MACSSVRFLEAWHSSRFFMANPLYGTFRAPTSRLDVAKRSRFEAVPNTHTNTLSLSLSLSLSVLSKGYNYDIAAITFN